MPAAYDAVVIVSFGGPEGPDDVLPFLENVTRSRNVPRERLLTVAEHYHRFGGRSPLNEQNRRLAEALRSELAIQGPDLPVFVGNRNWHPLLADTFSEMAAGGVRRALAFVTSAFGSYSGCRQYLENIQAAQASIVRANLQVDKLRAFWNLAGFIEPMVAKVQDALQQVPEPRRGAAQVIFTAHSIPFAMSSGAPYAAQLAEASRLVAGAVGTANWRLAYQSRSGPPTQPWLEPDILDALGELHAAGTRDVIVVPIGFISDHMEVIYDLDVEAAEFCTAHGLNMIRAGTVGVHPKFVRMIRDLVAERTLGEPRLSTMGTLGPSPDFCPPDCCPPGRRPPSADPGKAG